MKDIRERLKSYEPLWENWIIDVNGLIGGGNFGWVYRLRLKQNIFGEEKYSALKIIPFIMPEMTMGKISIEEKKTSVLKEIVNMDLLSENPYVVKYMNYAVKDIYNDNNQILGFDVLIQMEYLTSLSQYLKNKKKLESSEVIKLALQIGCALKFMHDKHMIHRDVKIDNIFINNIGNYLIGDLGVSKQMETSRYSTVAGTQPFIAPEVWNAQKSKVRYTKTADIYSYGITLYYLLNNNMLPLVTKTSSEKNVEDAIYERLAGKSFARPENGRAELQEIVMKCCSYNPEDRYQDFKEILRDLQALTDEDRRNVSGDYSADLKQNIQNDRLSKYKTVYADNTDCANLENDNHRKEETGNSITNQNSLNKDVKDENELGDMYFWGEKIEQDYDMAVYFYQISAHKGNYIAQNNLGHCFEFGIGVSKDYRKAAEWYLKSAEQGYAPAQFNIGECYYYGQGVKKDRSEAIFWYIKAARQNEADAQYVLGNCYYKGKDIDRNYSEAVQWYKKAAEQGHRKAAEKLGDCYWEGKGVDSDEEVAAYWYEKADNYK